MTSKINGQLLKNCSIYLHEDTKSLTSVFCGRRVRCDSMWLVLTECVDFITVCPVDHIRGSQWPQQCRAYVSPVSPASLLRHCRNSLCGEIQETRWHGKSRSNAFSATYFKTKSKGSFYIAQYPVRWTTQSALHFFVKEQTL